MKAHAAEKVNKALKRKLVKPDSFIYPPNPEFGDLSLACFELAKQHKKTPIELCSELVNKIPADKIIAGVKAVGPYLNFTFNKTNLTESVLKEIGKEKDKYGANKTGKSKKVMIEFSNANTHKEYHVGHLRNLCFGDSVSRILAANGFKSIPVSYINDFGIHVAKTVWKLKNRGMKDIPQNKGFYLGQIYAQATKELKEDEKANLEVRAIMKSIESRKGEDHKLWFKTREWSIDQFDKIYAELGVKFDNIFYESEFIEKGKDLVSELYEKRVLKRSEGAIIADLGESLGVLVIVRTDGTTTYPVADIPLALEKFKKYKLDKSIYVVDVRQSLYFKQLFAILEKLGVKKEMVHLAYEFVKLPSGMMSSREGNVITYEDLKEKLLEKTISETKKRHENWNSAKINQTAWKIAVGAVKFEMIKVSAGSVITFDIDQALRFDGFTAAYLQYTFARVSSILRKAGKQSAKADYSQLAEPREHQLILKLSKYPEITEKAGKNYDPAEIAKYLFELAQMFNDYYHNIPVLKAEDSARQARLALLSSVNTVINNGLNLLGIEILEEM